MATQAFTSITFDNMHRAGAASRGQRVKALFDTFAKDAAVVGTMTGYNDPNGTFYLKDFPTAQKKVNQLLQELHDGLQTEIEKGNESAWALADSKNDAMVKDLVERAAKRGVQIEEQRVEKWMKRNTDALQSFQQRTVQGMNLSQRVWNICDQTKTELEMALEIGLGDGKSAASLSRDVRQYLNEPNKLFRRVRDKKTGKLRLSKAAQEYHSGRGVYRSSYKNALRMTATENNMAYRSADHERVQQMDFVLGIEIHTSNNHPVPDICDELKGKYPKEFKFVGWHPWCRCFVTTILPTLEDFAKYARLSDREAAAYDFGGKKIDKLPPGFNKWVLNPDNALRLANAKNLPYFIRDNFVQGGWLAHSPQSLRKGLTWVANPKKPAKPTPQEIAAQRHAARPAGYREQLLDMRYFTRQIDTLLENTGQYASLNKTLQGWHDVLKAERFSKTSSLAKLKEYRAEYEKALDIAINRVQNAANNVTIAASQFESAVLQNHIDKMADLLDGRNWVELQKATRELAPLVKQHQIEALKVAKEWNDNANKLIFNADVAQKKQKLEAIINSTAVRNYKYLRATQQELADLMDQVQKQTWDAADLAISEAKALNPNLAKFKKFEKDIQAAVMQGDYATINNLTLDLQKAIKAEQRAQARAAAKAAAQAAAQAKAAMNAGEQEMGLLDQFQVLKKYQSYMKKEQLAYRYIDRIEQLIAEQAKNASPAAQAYYAQQIEATMAKLKAQKGFMKIVTTNEGDNWMMTAGAKAAARQQDFPAFPDLKGIEGEGKSSVDLSTLGYDDLKKELKGDVPVILKNYKKSVARTQYVDAEYIENAEEIEKKMKEYFEGCDYAHRTNLEYLQDTVSYDGVKEKGLYISRGIPTNLEVGEEIARVEGRKFRLGDYDESRRRYGDFAYNLDKHLKSNEYYRCGTPVPKGDRTRAWKEGRAESYGDAQIILRKDRVIATWTYGNSLSTEKIPSLASDPKVCSLDKGALKKLKTYRKEHWEKMDDIMKNDGAYSNYIEMQYLPRKGAGTITPQDIESITLKNESLLNKLTDEAKEQWYEHGVDIYYMKDGKAVLWKKGKPQITLTKAEEKAVQEAAEKALAFENKDLSLQPLRDLIKKKDYIGANEEGKRLAREYAKLKEQRDKLKDLIPDVDELHKTFTLEELKGAHTAISKKLQWIDSNYGDNFADAIKKLEKEIEIVEHPEKFKHTITKVRHSTWQIAQKAYKRKIEELQVKLNIKETREALDAAKALGTQSGKIKDLLAEAETLLDSGDYIAAGEKIKEAEKVRSINAKNVMRRKAREARVAAFGEATGIQFSPTEFTQAKRNAAHWFHAEGENPSTAALQKAFNEADEHMTEYASELWNRLSQEEKEVLYLYTCGSRWVNEPLFGRFYGAVKEGVDGTIRRSNADINALTTIIEKSKPLEEAMWVQHGEDMKAFRARFGSLPTTEAELKKLIGKEAINDPFMSTSCAKDSLFCSEKHKPENNVILNIYCPKGTKGVYCEPFAHWGDGKLYGKENTRYQKEGIKWDGEKRNKDAGDQVEFLLQRGAKLRITKAEYTGGRWYIDCDLVEQTARVTFNKEGLSIY